MKSDKGASAWYAMDSGSLVQQKNPEMWIYSMVSDLQQAFNMGSYAFMGSSSILRSLRRTRRDSRSSILRMCIYFHGLVGVE